MLGISASILFGDTSNPVTNCYDDANVLNIAYALESTMNYKGMIVGEHHE